MTLPPLLECIPNVSEGRNMAVIEQLTTAITSVSGTYLLHRDIGFDANRTVFTFVGEPDSVRLSAKRLARACRDLIDLRNYSGTHPYVGALDVCPFVALWGLSPKHALEAADELARFSASELEVPTYLYEHSASRPAYRSLAQVRRGGLAKVALRTGEEGPDYGEGSHPTAGVSVVGARDLLVAYNINLTTSDVELAKHIARQLRAAARTQQLPRLRAIGWYQASFGCAQVSINLLEYRRTGLGEAYLAVQAHARAVDVDVAGSELIGLVPLNALTSVPLAFGQSAATIEEAAHQAVSLLGLRSVRPFEVHQRVLEYLVQELYERR